MIDSLLYKEWATFICKSKLTKCWSALGLNLRFNNSCLIHTKEILKYFPEPHEESLRYGNTPVLSIDHHSSRGFNDWAVRLRQYHILWINFNSNLLALHVNCMCLTWLLTDFILTLSVWWLTFVFFLSMSFWIQIFKTGTGKDL